MSQGFQEGDRVRLEGTVIGFGSGGVVQVSGGTQPHHHLWLASPDEVTLIERAEPYFIGQVITKDMRRPLPGTTVVWVAIDGKHSHTITETTRWPFPGEDGVPVRIVDLPHMPTDLSAQKGFVDVAASFLGNDKSPLSLLMDQVGVENTEVTVAGERWDPTWGNRA